MNNPSMLQIERADGRFIYRTAGVAVDRDRVLIHRSEDDDFWALPGGRVEMGEIASEALAREMHEELGIQVEVGRLLWIVENFFTYAGYACHELALYFWMTLPPDAPLRRAAGPFYGDEFGLPLIFRWLPFDQLPATELYPIFLKRRLLAIPDHPQHVIVRPHPQAGAPPEVILP